jgi:pyruvate/2-oxoacid:ferredoxin oxidoreductase alpha subunit
MVEPGIPAWAVWGDLNHRRNLITSIELTEVDLEKRNLALNEKYAAMQAEARSESYRTDDADVVLVACNTPARAAKGAVQSLREAGLKVGLFRPVTIWPFPVDALRTLLPHTAHLVVVEASAGQIADEMRLALSRAGVTTLPAISGVRHMGGVLPQQSEIVEHVRALVAR